MGGRLNASAMQWQSKHPIILPNDGIVFKLIMKDVYESSRRVGRQHILSHLRQQFWLIKVNSTVSKALNNCAFCRKQFGQLNKQKMADLCEDRLLSDKLPFTIVGLDCFGSF